MGCFYLPFSIGQTGFFTGTLLTLTLGIINAFTMLLILSCENECIKIEEENESNQKVTSCSYPLIARIAFSGYEVNIIPGFQRFNPMEAVVYIGICLTSLGVCATYISICTTLIHNVNPTISTSFLTWFFIFPCLLLLSCLRSKEVFHISAILGNVAVLIGCISIVISGLFPSAATLEQSVTFNHPLYFADVAGFLGRSGFLFSVHIVLLPIIQRHRGDMHTTGATTTRTRFESSVVIMSYTLITIFNLCFGLISCLLYALSPCFEESILVQIGPCPNILNNLPPGTLLDAIKLLVCGDLLFTMPLVLAVSRELVEALVFTNKNKRVVADLKREGSASTSTIANPMVFVRVQMHDVGEGGEALRDSEETTSPSHSSDKIEIEEKNSPSSFAQEFEESRCEYWLRNFVRLILVLLVVLLSVSLDNVADLLSIVGGVVCSVTGYILPPIIYLKLHWHGQKITRGVFFLLFFIILFGLLTMTFSLFFVAK